MKGIQGALGNRPSKGFVVLLWITTAVGAPAATQFYYYPSSHNCAETFVWYSTGPLEYRLEKNQVIIGPIMINSRIRGLIRERSLGSQCCTGMRYNAATKMFTITGCSATDVLLVRAGTAITNAHLLIVTVLHAPQVSSISMTSGINRPVVIIDPGHGGIDAGRISIQGVPEKEITLNISRKLCALLRAQGAICYVTRDSDVSLSLDMRVRIANETNSLLFVSVHANGSKKATVEGIESYYYDPRLLKNHDGGCYGVLKKSWAQRELLRAGKSSQYAHIIHDALLRSIQKIDPAVCNRGVKQAVSQVLFGTTMPAVLVEIGFLSHERESKLLLTDLYQNAAAQGLCEGITEIFAQEVRALHGGLGQIQ